jgi:hypothetical protein
MDTRQTKILAQKNISNFFCLIIWFALVIVVPKIPKPNPSLRRNPFASVTDESDRLTEDHFPSRVIIGSLFTVHPIPCGENILPFITHFPLMIFIKFNQNNPSSATYTVANP